MRKKNKSGDPRKGTQPRPSAALEADTQLITAIAKLVEVTGATNFQVRFQDDDEPVVWIAVAVYPVGDQVGAALTPGQAAWELGEKLIDGGHCNHCQRPTALVEGEGSLMEIPHVTTDVAFCEYRYRAGRIVRGCDSLPVGTAGSMPDARDETTEKW